MAKHKQKPRRYYRYLFKLGRRIVHGGMTDDLERRETEHRRESGWSNGHLIQVGRRTTKKAAQEWEDERGYN